MVVWKIWMVEKNRVRNPPKNTSMDSNFFELDEFLKFFFGKNITNSIYIIWIEFNSSLIKNENSFIIINKLKK